MRKVAYTEQENNLLKAHYGKLKNRDLLALMCKKTGKSRTMSSMKHHAGFLKLTKPKPENAAMKFRPAMIRMREKGLKISEVVDVINRGPFDGVITYNQAKHICYSPSRPAETIYGTITDRIGMTINKFLKLPAPGAY